MNRGAAEPDPAAPFGLVVNPSSALGRGRRVAARARRVLDAAGVPTLLISGADADECRAAVRDAAAHGLRGLILVGGDGLIGLVIQLPEARALPIGIVPAGSGNDFARQFGVPKRARAAVRRALAAEHRPRHVDLGLVRLPDPGPGDSREHRFAGGLSVGLDARVNRRANAIRLPLGPFRYHLALVVEVLLLRGRALRVRSTDASGGTAERRFLGLLTTAMNIRAIGGGIPLAPSALPDDGLLDLVEVRHAAKLRILGLLGVLARGAHERLPEVTMTRISAARIDAGDEVAYADGEPVGTGPFEITVDRGALTLLA